VENDEMESAEFYDCVDVDHARDGCEEGKNKDKRAIHE